jgi:hypothetical protein
MLRSMLFVLIGSICAPAMAQVIYLPVQYQFSTGCGDQHYFYGGVDPRVHATAHQMLRTYYPNNLHNFDGGNSFGQPSVLHDRPAVFSDDMPFQNVARFGYTEADAHNEAYANAARYYRKSDELAAAIPAPDGSLIVPPTPVYITPTAAPRASTTQPSHGQIIIIPKRMLDRKSRKASEST